MRPDYAVAEMGVRTTRASNRNSKLRVLLLDARSDAGWFPLQILQDGGFESHVGVADSELAMCSALAQQRWDVILANYSLTGFTTLDALRIVRNRTLDIPFIVVSDVAGEERAVEAIKAGADDYIMATSLQRLVVAVEREMRLAAERSAKRKAERALAHQALHDSLTDLPNRVLFHDRLQQAVLSSTRHGWSLALLMMDLDHFKHVNDTLGHQAGDVLLQQVAQRLRKLMRNTDTVARLGGDEFAIVLPGARVANDALTAAEKVQRAVETPFLIDGETLLVGTSIGIAQWPEHGAEIPELIRHADEAMYQAKRGRSGYVLYSSQHLTERSAG